MDASFLHYISSRSFRSARFMMFYRMAVVRTKIIH